MSESLSVWVETPERFLTLFGMTTERILPVGFYAVAIAFF
jgi:hypothetical protein